MSVNTNATDQQGNIQTLGLEIEMKQDKQTLLNDSYVGSREEAPVWVLDNQYLLAGFRINFNTVKNNLKSLFIVHNELINIWSHIIGIVIALGLIYCLSNYITEISGIKNQINKDLNNYFTPTFEQLQKLNQTRQYNKKINQTEIEADYQLLQNISQNILQNQDEGYEQILDQIDLFLKQAQQLIKLDPDFVKQNFNNIMQNLQDIQQNLLQRIDSEEFDWVDVYKYINWPSDATNRHPSDPRHITRWPVLFFLLTSIQCFLGSSLFHLFNTISPQVYKYLLRLDYGMKIILQLITLNFIKAGICFIIAGGCTPLNYYSFYCEPQLQIFYIYLTCGLCTLVFFISLCDFIHTEKYRQLKGGMYGALGLLCTAPLIHTYIRSLQSGSDNDYLNVDKCVFYYVGIGFSLFGGLIIYLARCPERFKPGRFDILGQSHQIWHLCVISAVFFGYFGSLEDLYQRKVTFCILR